MNDMAMGALIAGCAAWFFGLVTCAFGERAGCPFCRGVMMGADVRTWWRWLRGRGKP
ncbi:MAG: hypothetical protein U1E40_10900 [Amaricoccus sp.]